MGEESRHQINASARNREEGNRGKSYSMRRTEGMGYDPQRGEFTRGANQGALLMKKAEFRREEESERGSREGRASLR